MPSAAYGEARSPLASIIPFSQHTIRLLLKCHFVRHLCPISTYLVANNRHGSDDSTSCPGYCIPCNYASDYPCYCTMPMWLITLHIFQLKPIKIGPFFGRCLRVLELCWIMHRGIWYTSCFSRRFVYLWVSSCRPWWFWKAPSSCRAPSSMQWLVVENCEQLWLCTQGPGVTPLAHIGGPIHPCRCGIQDIPERVTGSATIRDRHSPHMEYTHRYFSPLWGYSYWYGASNSLEFSYDRVLQVSDICYNPSSAPWRYILQDLEYSPTHSLGGRPNHEISRS